MPPKPAVNKKFKTARRAKGPKVKFYPEKTRRLVKDKDEIAQLEEQCAEVINTNNIKRFLDLPLSKRTFLGLKRAGYEVPTDIQREAVPLALKSYDILGAAKTGSGKTLAFLIPVLENLYRNQWSHLDGLGALVITPVRELAYQIFEVLKKIGRQHDFSAGLLIGGSNLRFERSRLKVCNIIIATPGRLLQHMDENPLMDTTNLKILVLDEADRILDLGFSRTMNAIIENLPQERQTLLFSATQTKSVKDLARLSLKDPMYVSVNEHAEHCTPDSLEQSYIVCEQHEKLDILWSFIKAHSKQKILVFMATCKQVKYACEVFCKMRPSISVMALYGTLHQLRRMAIYNAFCEANNALLLATDIAARGLDFPEINWVIQLDCPEDVNTYIHRAGRTARFEADGESILVLLPSEEEAMISQIQRRKIPITKISVNPNQQRTIQRKLEAFLARDVSLKESAQRAFVSYVKAVFKMKDKKVFNIHKLDTDAYARSLGLAIPPRLRFLQKHRKNAEQQKSSETAIIENLEDKESPKVVTEDSTAEKINYDDDKDAKTECFKMGSEQHFASGMAHDSDDELFTVKRRITYDNPDDVDAKGDKGTAESSARHKKPLTKASAAKKILKKKIQPNAKLYFTEDGEAIEDVRRKQMSEAAKDEDEDEGGINIERAKAIMREEDIIDKKLYQQRIRAMHKEKRLKEKAARRKQKEGGSDDEDEQQTSSDEAVSMDLSVLPDPDKVPGKESDEDSDNQQSADESTTDQSSSESQTSDNVKKVSEKSRKRYLERKMMKSNKRTCTYSSSDESDNVMDTGLSLGDDEELALRLLATR